MLLVDDHPMNRELGDALLTLAGCQVSTAEDGFQAVEAARGGGATRPHCRQHPHMTPSCR